MISTETFKRIDEIAQRELDIISESISKTLLVGDKKYRLYDFVSESYHSEDTYSFLDARKIQLVSESLTILEEK